VALEATGIYSLELELAVADAAAGIEVAVLNPKAVNRFAQTIRRSKTDKAEARAWTSTVAPDAVRCVAGAGPPMAAAHDQSPSRRLDLAAYARKESPACGSGIGDHAALRGSGT
jgi:hypothetical protein